MVVNLAIIAGYLVRFNFDWNLVASFGFKGSLVAGTVTSLTATLITRSYAGIVRYTGIEDGKRIAVSSLLSFSLLMLANLASYYTAGQNLIPYSVILGAFPISFFILFFYRLFVKELFAFARSYPGKERQNVLVFGAGNLGISVRQVLENSGGQRLVAFMEDDENKVGKKLEGLRIHSIKDFEQLVVDTNAKELIVAVNNLTPERKAQLVDEAVRLHVKVRIVPPAERWIKGELSIQQIKELKIEDLLGRDVITLGNEVLEREIRGKRVCITGAAGSIGSEIARQVALLKPESIFLLDQAESDLFEIQHELTLLRAPIELGIADVTNSERIDWIFSEFRPHIIFHAAAYKHVPLMESNPAEAMYCNILGTRIVADAAVKYGADKFVMISTDKAVNPTSVMGCSKRIAEMYVQSLNNHLLASQNVSTAFVTTRFGNVLGSNGSVVPIFRKQIETGGPVTVTHPEVRRYFMTIPEACRLVLEAGVMGMGGEIFIFDMGEPIKIYDLARKMVQLSGLEVGRDIEIVFTGLRQGEKLFEELLANKENTVPTHHSKILKARVQPQPYDKVASYLDLMMELVNDKNELKIVALMKEMVPEYKSNYSRYEVLDKLS